MTSWAYQLQEPVNFWWGSGPRYMHQITVPFSSPLRNKKKGKKERIVLREIHLRTTGRHLSMGSHSVICHPTEVTAPPSPQTGRLVLDLSTP